MTNKKNNCDPRQYNNKCECVCKCPCPIKSNVYIASYYQDRGDADNRQDNYINRGEFMSFASVIEPASKKMINPVVRTEGNGDNPDPSKFWLCPGTYRISYTATWVYNPRQDPDPRQSDKPNDNIVTSEIFIADGSAAPDTPDVDGEFFNTRNIMSMYIPYKYKPPSIVNPAPSEYGEYAIRVNVGGTYLITIEKFMSIGLRRARTNRGNNVGHAYRDRTIIIDLITCAGECEKH